jgi:hypothetical protein
VPAPHEGKVPMKAMASWVAAFLCLAAPALAKDVPAWRGHANDAQHTARAPAAGQPLTSIHWSMAVDLDPPLAPHQRPGGGETLIHYGSPMITAMNTVLVPVKTTSKGDFEIEAVTGTKGKSVWTMKTDYLLPPHDWIPPLPAHLTGQNRLYVAGAGGTVWFRDTPDSATGKSGQLAFYGLAQYKKNKKIYDSDVIIDTPITADAKGDIFFGFVVLASNPVGLISGIARMDASGKGTWISAERVAQDPQITQVAMSCAPAVSADGSTIYITVSNGGSLGYLVGLDSTTLEPEYRTQLIDPETHENATISDDSSAAPTIGPDGTVYYGVYATSENDHNCRGWLLAFSADLGTENTPGSFGWDDTVSVVPTDATSHPPGKSSYYIMSKYNNYIDCGSGDGENEIAILNPFATQEDEYSDVTVMKEVETILDPHSAPGGGVYEWCVNTAVVDVKNKSIVVNDEDGKAYRWDLATNSLEPQLGLSLNAATFEAYTPTLIGPDGTDYAINNATLYAIGK